MKFDFSKNQKVAAANFEATVPSDFRGLYRKAEDGNYALGSEDPGVASAVAAITGLSTALNASRAEATDYKGRVVDLSTLKDFGTTPADILANVQQQLEEARKKGGKEDAERQLQAAREALTKEHAKQTDGLNTRISGLTSQLHKLLLSGQATEALVEHQAVDPDLVLPHVLSRVRVVEDNGQMHARVVGDDGGDRYSGNGGFMTINELVREMREQKKYGPLFRSDSPAGGGNPPTHRGAPAQGRELSATEKIAVGLTARRK